MPLSFLGGDMYILINILVGFTVLITGFILGRLSISHTSGTIEVSSNPDKDFYTLHLDNLDDLETKDKVIFYITRS